MKRKKSLVKVLCLITALMMLFFVAACDNSDDGDDPIVPGPIDDSKEITATVDADGVIDTKSEGYDMGDVLTDLVLSLQPGTEALMEDGTLGTFPLTINMIVSDGASEATFADSDFDHTYNGIDVAFKSAGHARIVSIEDAQGNKVASLTQPVQIALYFEDKVKHPFTGADLKAQDRVKLWTWESPPEFKKYVTVLTDSGSERLYITFCGFVGQLGTADCIMLTPPISFGLIDNPQGITGGGGQTM